MIPRNPQNNGNNHIPWNENLICHLLDCVLQTGAHLSNKAWSDMLIPFYTKSEYLRRIFTSSNKVASERKLREKYRSEMNHYKNLLGVDGRPGNLSAQITPTQEPILDRIRQIDDEIKEKEGEKQKKKAQTERLERVELLTLNTNDEGQVASKIRENDGMVSYFNFN
jgi:hypothetical protein